MNRSSPMALAAGPAPATEEQRRLLEYEMLLDVGVQLAGTLDPTTVLELALESAEKVCRAETSSIWEVDEERGDLFFRVVRGRAANDIRTLRVPLGEGIVGTVAEWQERRKEARESMAASSAVRNGAE